MAKILVCLPCKPEYFKRLGDLVESEHPEMDDRYGMGMLAAISESLR
jgi:hypothetical protein